MRFIILILGSFLLTGCTVIELTADLIKKIDRSGEARQTSSGARYKVGDPYQVNNVWYYPERNLNYDETGIASWYGDKFAGKATANGEIFNPDLVSAAHKTLPMPSVVRVTNLENGRSLVVRVNDRGPFISTRIIDLSEEAARLLGFRRNGLARVRVQILAEESLRLEREAKRGNFPLLGSQSAVPKPETTAAVVPSVSLSTNATKKKPAETVSSIDLISSNRVTDVIELHPVDTDIYIQVGTFDELGNAEVVLKRVRPIGRTDISSFDDDGRLIHRVRIGPFSDIHNADEALHQVMDNGYRGAKIILD